MGRLPSRIGASHATGSNRRSSHVHSYFTQLRAVIYVFRPVSASALPAATSAHPQHGRCPSGLRGRQDVSRFAAPVRRRTRCVQYGRLSAHQPLAGRRCAYDPTSPSSRLGGCSGRAKQGTQGHLHHDHNDSSKRKPRYKNGFCYLVCTLRIGQLVVTVDVCLYLRAKTVRRINRHRAAEQRLAFRSKNTLARQILAALRPLLPTGWTVYVQFDSWYASAKLINYVRRQKWHVTCGLKCNRTLNGVRIDHLASALRHRRYTRVRITATDGNITTYYVRQTTGRLSDVPHDVRVLFSKRHPRGKTSAYFLSTDLTRSAHQALQGYGGRWSCEVDNFYLKTRLGLADFRVRSYEAVDKYMVVVHLAWGYIERRFIQERAAQVKCYGDIIRRHQEEHAREWLTGALQMVLETGAIEPVLQRFLREMD